METRVVVNPAAGAGRSGARARSLRGRLETAFGALDWRETTSSEHVTELVAEAARAGHPRVLVAGGDGTAHFAANGVVGTRTALGILPVGTGNDVAYSAGVPKDLGAAVDTLALGHVRELDVGRVTKEGHAPRFYCCVLGVGMDSEALERINSARFLRRGRLLYTLAALRTALSYRCEEVEIGWDGGFFKGEIIFAAITNTKSYAGGMKITPLALVDDGALDLCVIPRMNFFRTLASFSRVLEGKHVGMSGIVMVQSPRFKISGPKPARVTLDGELTDLTTPIDVTVLPRALRVLGAPIARSEPAVTELLSATARGSR